MIKALIFSLSLAPSESHGFWRFAKRLGGLIRQWHGGALYRRHGTRRVAEAVFMAVLSPLMLRSVPMRKAFQMRGSLAPILAITTGLAITKSVHYRGTATRLCWKRDKESKDV